MNEDKPRFLLPCCWIGFVASARGAGRSRNSPQWAVAGGGRLGRRSTSKACGQTSAESSPPRRRPAGRKIGGRPEDPDRLRREGDVWSGPDLQPRQRQEVRRRNLAGRRRSPEGQGLPPRRRPVRRRDLETGTVSRAAEAPALTRRARASIPRAPDSRFFRGFAPFSSNKCRGAREQGAASCFGATAPDIGAARFAGPDLPMARKFIGSRRSGAALKGRRNVGKPCKEDFRQRQRSPVEDLSARRSRRSMRSSPRSPSSPTRRCAPARDEFRAQLAAGQDARRPAGSGLRHGARGGQARLGQRHFDVQLIGGMVLHEGAIAEMRTGEGKTLVATLACYLNALAGNGVHVVTVNDYLARRDAEWMGRDLQVPRPERRHHRPWPRRRRAPRGLCRRHHLWHQQRVRLRLSARQHEIRAGPDGPARPCLRHRRRGRFDPDRRGAHAADHFRPVGRPVRSLQCRSTS